MKYHVIHGLDADLILLSLLSDIPGIILMRHDYGNYVMIDRLRNHILEDMISPDQQNVDPKILITDFCCLMALIGNDFLKPHIMCSKMENAIPMLVEAYHKLGKQFSNKDGKIDFGVFQEYCKLLVDKEKDAVIEHLMDALKEIPKYRSFPAEMTIEEIRKKLNIELNQKDEPESKDSIMKIQNYITGNIKTIYKIFRIQYNKNAVVPFAFSVFSALTGEDVNKMLNVSDKKMHSMRKFCIKYLEGIQWNIVYYLFGHNQTKNDWGFNYHYSPLMIDLVEYMNTSDSHKKMRLDKYKVSEQKWHGLVTQSLTVIPKEKMDILPPSLHKYYTDEQIGLLDQFPMTYKIDYFNYKDNIHSRVLTNFPDIAGIVEKVEAIPITGNAGYYRLDKDYESRVPNMKLAIENRIKDLNAVRQRAFFEKKILSQQQRQQYRQEKTPLVSVGRGGSSRGRGRGGSARGRGATPRTRV
jgi:5'-3' exonuclease